MGTFVEDVGWTLPLYRYDQASGTVVDGRREALSRKPGQHAHDKYDFFVSDWQFVHLRSVMDTLYNPLPE